MVSFGVLRCEDIGAGKIVGLGRGPRKRGLCLYKQLWTWNPIIQGMVFTVAQRREVMGPSEAEREKSTHPILGCLGGMYSLEGANDFP